VGFSEAGRPGKKQDEQRLIFEVIRKFIR